jgi:ribosomal protein S18 acetylase RimI-like enzyme
MSSLKQAMPPPTPAFTLRPATLADVPALAVLAEATFCDTFGPEGFDLRYPPADLAEFLTRSYAHDAVAGWITDPRGHVMVAEGPDGALLAYSHSGDNELPLPGAGRHDGELKRIYVRRDCQGTGIGRVLLEEALSWMTGHPILIGVWSLNLKAQRLYAHYGFEKVGEYEFAVGAVRDAEFILRRG